MQISIDTLRQNLTDECFDALMLDLGKIRKLGDLLPYYKKSIIEKEGKVLKIDYDINTGD